MQEFWFKHADNDTYMAQRYRGDEQTVTVPASWYGCPVSVLMDDLFKGHREIENVILPDTVTDIGGFVFDGCSSLKQIILPSSLRNLWQYAFVRSSFGELLIPEGVRDIVPFCFKDCRELTRIEFTAEHLRIMGWAFEGCESLKEIVISRDAVIHETAFSGCSAVTIIRRNRCPL